MQQTFSSSGDQQNNNSNCTISNYGVAQIYIVLQPCNFINEMNLLIYSVVYCCGLIFFPYHSSEKVSVNVTNIPPVAKCNCQILIVNLFDLSEAFHKVIMSILFSSSPNPLLLSIFLFDFLIDSLAL